MTSADTSGDLLLAEVTITRHLDEQGRDMVSFHAIDNSGDPLGVMETLGLIETAKHYVLLPDEEEDDL